MKNPEHWAQGQKMQIQALVAWVARLGVADSG